MNSSKAAEARAEVATKTDDEVEAQFFDWSEWALPKQLAPEGDWTTWLLMGGRGSGKTRAGAEWVRQLAKARVGPIALVGETMAEAIAIMVRGESGIFSVHPDVERPVLRGNRLIWPNGTEATILSASDPERFRGPQFAAAWCDELGCAAVDKGANQPNIFGDSKSAEDGRPYFSAGTPDDLMQRQVLRAHLRHWADPGHNPPGMVDTNRIYLWTWDARPYPAFPGLSEVWSDGVNHRTGHWLTGRLGGFGSDELAAALGAEADVVITGTAAAPLLIGYTVAASGSVRDALEPVLQATGQTLRNTADGLHLHGTGEGPLVTLTADMLAEEERPVLARRRTDPAERPGRLALSFVDRERDYAAGTVTAIAGDGPLQSHGVALAFAPVGSRLAAERLLDGVRARGDSLESTLPPTMLELETGDRINLVGQKDGPFEIAEVRDGLARRVTAKSLPRAEAIAVEVDRRPCAPLGVATRSAPVLMAAHLPPRPEDAGRSRLVIGGYAVPWPGALQVIEDITGAGLLDLAGPATMGTLLGAVAMANSGAWDDANLVEIALFGGHLAAASDAAVLAGSNRLAVEGADGHWEVLGFAQAELIGPRRYALTRLQRGLDGTAPAAAAAGARVMLLDGRAGEIAVPPSWLGAERLLRVFAGTADLAGTPVPVDLATPF